MQIASLLNGQAQPQVFHITSRRRGF